MLCIICLSRGTEQAQFKACGRILVTVLEGSSLRATTGKLRRATYNVFSHYSACKCADCFKKVQNFSELEKRNVNCTFFLQMAMFILNVHSASSFIAYSFCSFTHVKVDSWDLVVWKRPKIGRCNLGDNVHHYIYSILNHGTLTPILTIYTLYCSSAKTSEGPPSDCSWRGRRPCQYKQR